MRQRLLAFGVWLGRATSPSPAPSLTATRPRPRDADLHRAYLCVLPLPRNHARPRDRLRIQIRRVAQRVAEIAERSADPQLLAAASRDGNLDVAVAATEGLNALYRDGRITAKELAERVTDAVSRMRFGSPR